MQDKRKIVIFKSRKGRLQNTLICGQKIVPVDLVKYLVLTLQSDLHWKIDLTSLEKNLSRSIGLVSKTRYYIPKLLLKTICYPIFNSHLIYDCEV